MDFFERLIMKFTIFSKLSHFLLRAVLAFYVSKNSTFHIKIFVGYLFILFNSSQFTPLTLPPPPLSLPTPPIYPPQFTPCQLTPTANRPPYG